MNGRAGALRAHEEGDHDGADAITEADARLVAGIRDGDTQALIAFACRFRPVLLAQARRLGVSPDDRENTVDSLLDDLAMRIARGAAPRTLASYVIRSFRNAVLMEHRQSRHERAAWADVTSGADRAPPANPDGMIIRSSCSEYTLRATGQSGEVDRDDAIGVAGALARHLFAQLGERDQKILVWRSHHVPARDIAEWLGISYGATRTRISRLCARLAEEAMRYRETVHGAERRRLDQFLERAGVQLHDRAAPHPDAAEVKHD